MKVLKDFDGKYAATEDGRIYSFATKKFLKSQVTKKGYLTVRLGRGHNYKNYRVHRLVADTFIPNPGNLPEVNHKDEDKTNNSVSNLEWCTQDYNLHYGSREHLSKKVYCVELDKTFLNARAAFKELGIKDYRIRYCCKGRRKTAGGYHWQYA